MFEDKLQTLITELHTKYPRLTNIITDSELDMYTDMYKAIMFDIPKGDIWNEFTEDYMDMTFYIKFCRKELEDNESLLALTEAKVKSSYSDKLDNLIRDNIKTLFQGRGVF